MLCSRDRVELQRELNSFFGHKLVSVFQNTPSRSGSRAKCGPFYVGDDFCKTEIEAINRGRRYIQAIKEALKK